MNDKDFDQQILGVVAPWKVVEARIGMEAKRESLKAETEARTNRGDPETGKAAH